MPVDAGVYTGRCSPPMAKSFDTTLSPIRVTDDQKADVERRAAAAGMKVSDYMRERLTADVLLESRDLELVLAAMPDVGPALERAIEFVKKMRKRDAATAAAAARAEKPRRRRA